MKPNVVFVPGMLCDERLFAPQFAALSEDFDCSLADLTRDDDITDMAMRVLADAPSDRFTLVGLSLGGIVAMEVARLAPWRLARLVLMATNHQAASEAFIATRTDQIARARRGGFREIVVNELKVHYLAPGHADHPRILKLVTDMALQAGPDVFERQARALMRRRDQTDTLRSCAVSSLIVAGAHDRLCSPRSHQIMRKLMPNAAFIGLPDVGHLAPLEAPGVTTEVLRRFVGEAVPGSPSASA
jgi:pimeloyl-ACP methyl ester carboxylesterase